MLQNKIPLVRQIQPHEVRAQVLVLEMGYFLLKEALELKVRKWSDFGCHLQIRKTTKLSYMT